MKKHAFTLAEVLITLGVIGVVAAMTLPIVINSYKDQVQLSLFKKIYSNISQAIRMVKAENGYYPICLAGNSSECLTLYEEFTKHMKVVKKCQDNAYIGGCIPHYEDSNNDYIPNGCSYFKVSKVNSKSSAFVFADGSILFSYHKLENSAGYNGNQIFAIDINGFKGPNKWGYDLFPLAFETKNNDEINIVSSGCAHAAPGGKSTETMLKK